MIGLSFARIMDARGTEQAVRAFCRSGRTGVCCGRPVASDESDRNGRSPFFRIRPAAAYALAMSSEVFGRDAELGAIGALETPECAETVVSGAAQQEKSARRVGLATVLATSRPGPWAWLVRWDYLRGRLTAALGSGSGAG